MTRALSIPLQHELDYWRAKLEAGGEGSYAESEHLHSVRFMRGVILVQLNRLERIVENAGKEKDPDS